MCIIRCQVKKLLIALDSFFSERRQTEDNRMARIPEAEIERLKREIALERLVEARG